MDMSGRRLTVTLAVVLAVLIVVGAGAAFGVGRAQRLAGQASTEGTTTAPPSSPGQPAASTAGGQSSPSQPTEQPPEQSSDQWNPTSQVQATPQPSSSEQQGPTASEEEPGLPVIRMSPRALTSARAQEVGDLLQRYFGAINRHDYDAWLTTVSRSQATRGRDDWVNDYQTTKDTDIYVSDIQDGNPLTVRMQFMSHQSVELAPSALPLPCVRWDVTYQLVDEGIGLRVGNSAEKPSMAPCT
jgi:hypothetical protein